MKTDEKIEYWMKSAEIDLQTADRLFSAGDYHWCLFIAHLVLEKALKAYYTKSIKDTPPRIHDLVKLAKIANLNLTEEKILFYNKVNDFNIETRYPDEKFSFYKIATKSFAEENLNKIKGEYKWIKSLLI